VRASHSPDPRDLLKYCFLSAVTAVSPRMGESGWPFASVDPFPGADADPLYNAQHVKDLYFKADPSYGGRYAFPDHRPDHRALTPLSGSPFRFSGIRRRRRSSTMKAPKSSASSTPRSTTCFPPKRRPSISTPRSTARTSTRSTRGCTIP
jgi:hypothetical protein